MHWSAPADNGSQSHYSRAVGVVGAHRVGTLRSVAVLSREEFDAIEFDAAFSGEHRSAAQRMTTLARTGTQTEAMPRAEAFLRAGEQWLVAGDLEASVSGEHRSAAQRMTTLARTGTQTEAMPRAEAFLRAGEQWLLADDPAAAASRFRMAMADGGSASVDPRVPLARALFQLGEADEARALIATLKGEGRTDPRACDLVAELLVEYSDPQGALEWATAGVELCLRYAEREGADRKRVG